MPDSQWWQSYRAKEQALADEFGDNKLHGPALSLRVRSMMLLPYAPSHEEGIRLFRPMWRGLAAIHANALWQAGYCSPEQVTQASDRELLAVRGLGKKGVANIRAWLETRSDTDIDHAPATEPA